MRSLTLAVDIDDTVADFIGGWLRAYNRTYLDSLCVDDINTWDIGSLTKHCTKGQLFDLLRAPDFYEDVMPREGAREGIYALLAQGHRVVYVTSCPDGTHDQKRHWLKRWDFLTDANLHRDFIAATDKSLIKADYLFDDRLENVQQFPGIGVLVNRPHNKAQSYGLRIDGMAQAPALFR